MLSLRYAAGDWTQAFFASFLATDWCLRVTCVQKCIWNTHDCDEAAILLARNVCYWLISNCCQNLNCVSVSNVDHMRAQWYAIVSYGICSDVRRIDDKLRQWFIACMHPTRCHDSPQMPPNTGNLLDISGQKCHSIYYRKPMRISELGEVTLNEWYTNEWCIENTCHCCCCCYCYNWCRWWLWHTLSVLTLYASDKRMKKFHHITPKHV